MVIDARYEFGKRFIEAQEGKTYEETNERLRVMGTPFTQMVRFALTKEMEENDVKDN